MEKKILLSAAIYCISAFNSIGQAQGTVTIDHKTQRYIGEVSTLDRGKYITAHVLFNEPDAQFETFKSSYNIANDYQGSRQFWNPFGKVKNGVIPNVMKTYDGIRDVNPYLVATGGASSLFWDDTKDYSVEDVSELSIKAADYVTRSYRDEWDMVPKYLEPFNEPMVHAIDYYPEGKPR